MQKKTTDEKTYGVAETDYKIEFCDHVLDNVYGHIGVTAVEKELERLPVFKRLHHVSQLGLVNWIFPCALHTRYVHSLGVMHIAWQMATQINKNKQYNFFSDNEIQLLRIAGMLHDIGHYPLSHNIEEVYKKDCASTDKQGIYDKLEYYINCPDYLNPNPPKCSKTPLKKLDDKIKGSDEYHHEAIGRAIIIGDERIFKAIKENYILQPKTYPNNKGERVLNSAFKIKNKTVYTEKDIDDITDKVLIMIGDIIVGNYEYSSDKIYPWAEKYSAMVQIMHSELDADGIDYLLRDATFSGTSYGIMDMSVLFSALDVSRIVIKCHDRDEQKYIVGIKKKGIGCVDQFLINKYLAYTQMTFHKYVSNLEAMILTIARVWVKSDKTTYSKSKLARMIVGENVLGKRPKPEPRIRIGDAYLRFVDSAIIDEIFLLEQQDSFFAPLYRIIVSYLKNYNAMELADANTEFVCAGTDENEIRSKASRNSLYKEFKKTCERKPFRCSSKRALCVQIRNLRHHETTAIQSIQTGLY